MENGKLIALSQYIQTQTRDADTVAEARSFAANVTGEVYDFQLFRNKAKARQSRFNRAKTRALSILNVIKALVQDYQLDMDRAALECDIEAYQKDYGYLPEVQIADDMRRLTELAECLDAALENKNVHTLMEACDLVRQTASEEVIATLNYILVSEYFGFKAISALVQSTRLNDESYFEDTMLYYQLWSAFEEQQFPNSVAATEHLCFEEAVAI